MQAENAETAVMRRRRAMVRPSDPGGPGEPGMPVDQAYGAMGVARIEVDVTSISEFAEVLRREIEENLRPAWHRIEQTLGNGAQFGLSPELEDLGDKRAQYEKYLKHAKLLFRDVIEGVDQFAQAADQIAASYTRADQFAKVTVDDVNKALPATPGGPPAGQGEYL
jgi:hypothetical protein